MLLILQGICYSGKTTLGEMLSKELNLPFKDFRDLFQDEYGCTESEHLTRYGTRMFKQAEKMILSKKYDNMVLSLSGSSVYNHNEMLKLSQMGKIIFLNVSLEILQDRRSKDPKADSRPILYPDGIISYEELYKERVKLYPQYSHIILDVTKKETPKETIERLKNIIYK